MSRKDDFWAGISAAFIFVTVITVVSAHGKFDTHPTTWWDILQFLFIMAVFSSAVVDVYKYRQRKYTMLTIDTIEELEQFSAVLDKKLKQRRKK